MIEKDVLLRRTNIKKKKKKKKKKKNFKRLEDTDTNREKEKEREDLRGQDGKMVDRLSSDLGDSHLNPRSDKKVFFPQFESDV